MAKTKAEIVLTAEEAGAFRAFQKLNDQIYNSGKKLDEVGAKGKKAGQTMGQAMQGGVMQIGKATAGIMGFGSALAAAGTAVGVIRMEAQRLLQLQRETRSFQVERGRAFQKAATTMGPGRFRADGETPFGHQDLFNELTSRSAATRANPITMGLAAEAAFAAGGRTPPERILDAQFAVAGLTDQWREDVDGTKAAGSGVLELMKARPELTANQSAATFLKAFRASRVENPAAFATQMMPMATQLAGFNTAPLDASGNRPQDSINYIMGDIAGFGQTIADPTGRVTRTNRIALAKEVMKYTSAPDQGFYGTVEQQMEFIRSDKKHIRALLGGGALAFPTLGLSEEEKRAIRDNPEGELKTGEAKAYAALVGSLVPGSSTSRNIAFARQQVGHGTQKDYLEVKAYSEAVRESPDLVAYQADIATRTAEERAMGSRTAGRRAAVLDSIDRVQLKNPNLGPGAVRARWDYAAGWINSQLPWADEEQMLSQGAARLARNIEQEYATPWQVRNNPLNAARRLWDPQTPDVLRANLIGGLSDDDKAHAEAMLIVLEEMLGELRVMRGQPREILVVSPDGSEVSARSGASALDEGPPPPPPPPPPGP
jgi:hypothetical protein